MPVTLTASLAASFAQMALANVVREYPGKADHVFSGPNDVQSPRALHPAFHGSFDWHSCVHMHWLLARVRRLIPDLPRRDAIDDVFDRHLTPDNIEAECAYLERPESLAFERTYGWAWLLELAHELKRTNDADAQRWSAALAPLADAIVRRYLAYLPVQRYPLRTGLHANSAFGLLFALDYARAADESALEASCTETARRWFGHDRNVPAAWEPSGADFLSPALVEADLMQRILPADMFAVWLDGFLPGLAHCDPATLFVPAVVDDRSDPFIVHLDGLNLARAWSFRSIAAALPADDPRITVLYETADRHLAAGINGLTSDDFVGTHWLASFAMLALTGGAR
jgi:hypothetical protein